MESPQQPQTAAHSGEELNMYSLTYPWHSYEPEEIAIELGLTVRTGPAGYAVIFDTESDLIAFRDLLEELHNV